MTGCCHSSSQMAVSSCIEAEKWTSGGVIWDSHNAAVLKRVLYRGCYCALTTAVILNILTPDLARGTSHFIAR